MIDFSSRNASLGAEPPPEDHELLRRYAAEKSEAAFAELVRRHVNFVYACALRRVGGDAHLAQDVAQHVFTALARDAAALANRVVLSGWLFTTARNASAQVVRTERRRQTREAEAQLMNDLTTASARDAEWEKLRPVLDDALDGLNDDDRQAVLLRFFEGKSFAEVGAKLRLTENTARMRVERALDKLHGLLAGRGVTSTTAALAVALANQPTIAAPVGLAAAVTGLALANGGIATAGAWTLFLGLTKTQIGIVSALVLAGATGYLLQANTNAGLRDEIASLHQQNALGTGLRAENVQLTRAAAEIAEMRNDDAELARLGDESAVLKTRLQQVTKAEQARATAAAEVEGSEFAHLDRLPRPISQVHPGYPFEVRRDGLGRDFTVLVDFVVEPEGGVGHARALNSINSGETPEKSENDAVHLVPITISGGKGGGGGSDAPSAAVTALLESAAVDAVSRWNFVPGVKAGGEVGTHMQVSIVFRARAPENAASIAPQN